MNGRAGADHEPAGLAYADLCGLIAGLLQILSRSAAGFHDLSKTIKQFPSVLTEVTVGAANFSEASRCSIIYRSIPSRIRHHAVRCHRRAVSEHPEFVLKSVLGFHLVNACRAARLVPRSHDRSLAGQDLDGLP